MTRIRTLALLAPLALAAASCGGGSSKAALPVLIARSPDDVAQITVEAPQRPPAVLTQTQGGFWSPGEGMTPETATMLFDGQNDLFPLRAYRRLDADPANPEFGLGEPAVTLSARQKNGRTTRVLFGTATFNQEGFYARRADDPHAVYLVPRKPVNLLRSLALGRTVEFDYPVDKKFEDLGKRAAKAPGEEPDAWTTQAVEHGATLPPDLP